LISTPYSKYFDLAHGRSLGGHEWNQPSLAPRHFTCLDDLSRRRYNRNFILEHGGRVNAKTHYLNSTNPQKDHCDCVHPRARQVSADKSAITCYGRLGKESYCPHRSGRRNGPGHCVCAILGRLPVGCRRRNEAQENGWLSRITAIPLSTKRRCRCRQMSC
jgi:hypothetical protein